MRKEKAMNIGYMGFLMGSGLALFPALAALFPLI